MMNKFALSIFTICLCVTFAAAQKTVRKRPQPPVIQPTENQASAESERNLNQPYSEKIYPNSKQVDSPVKILEKPRATYPKSTGCFQGKVVLRVTFLKSGEIGGISVISGLGNGATESAVDAAKKIKFIPATKDGYPVSLTIPVEYVFSIY